jgi:hypothetical protein
MKNPTRQIECRRLSETHWQRGIVAAMCLGLGILDCPGAAPELLPLRPGTELFVDDLRLERRENVTRRIHPARKLDQPVLRGDNGKPARIYGTTWRDPESGLFHMWYGRSYATSKDGLHWEKPRLDVYPLRGKPSNIVLPKGGGGVLVDHLEPDPNKRFKALLAEPIHTGGFSGYHSADGIHWTRYGEDRLLTVGSEVGQIMRDPATQKYFAFIRPYPPKYFPRSMREKRLGAVLTSDDFVNWSEMRVVLAPDRLDDAWVRAPEQRTEFYAMNGFAYGNSYLGIIPVFRIERIIDKTTPDQSRYDGPMEGQLITSRDGQNWQRGGDRSPVLPSGAGFDRSIMNVAMAPLIVEDEIWHYYTAINGTHGAPSPPKSITIALARWRLDGYVSLDAGSAPAVVQTTLLDTNGARSLEVNADASRGRLVVEILDGQGEPVPGYTAADCEVIRGDSPRHAARWSGENKLPDIEEIRLRFLFSECSLFSYTLQPIGWAPR